MAGTNLALGGVETFAVPGEHTNNRQAMMEPHVDFVRDRLLEYLDVVNDAGERVTRNGLKHRVDQHPSPSPSAARLSLRRSRYYDGRATRRSQPRARSAVAGLPHHRRREVGTTTLYGWLTEHPSSMPAVEKEVHFFDYDFFRAVDWYRAHFPLERDRDAFEREHGRPFLTGEASPSYISHVGRRTSCQCCFRT